MRWFWIDRFVEFVHGQRAVAIKNVTLAEEHLGVNTPGFALMPTPLILEGIAQTGGLLVSQYFDFKQRVVLAKVGKAMFHRPARPGDTLTYAVDVDSIQDDGAIVRATSHIGNELQAEVNMMFANLDDRFAGVEQFSPGDFLRWLRALRMFEVGVDADGNPLEVPAEMLAAEGT